MTRHVSRLHRARQSAKLAGIFGVALALTWMVSHLRATRIKQFCGRAIQWRVSFQPIDDKALVQSNGIYGFSTHALVNGFGLQRPDRRLIVITNVAPN